MGRFKASWVVYLFVLVALLLASSVHAEVTSFRITNNSGAARSDLHLIFTGTGGTATLAVTVNAPGCAAPVVTNPGQPWDITWPAACVANGASVTVKITSSFPVAFSSGHWTPGNVALAAGDVQQVATTFICIDGDGVRGDRYLNNAEGYYRQNHAGATIQVGGSFSDCLGQVRAGDILIIIVHGNKGLFRWGGNRYAGFSGGRGATGTGVGGVLNPFPLPNNFNNPGINITATMEACFSSTAAAQGISVVASLQAGLAAGAPAVVGSVNQSETFRGEYTLAGGTPAQRTAAQACLQAAAVAADAGNTNDTTGVQRWLAGVPPANSPSNPNSQTVANNAISNANCAGAGGAVTMSFAYVCVPIDPSFAPSVCEGDIDCDSTAIPALTPGGLVLLALVLMGSAVLILRRAVSGS